VNRDRTAGRKRAEILALLHAAEHHVATTGEAAEQHLAALHTLSSQAPDADHDPAAIATEEAISMVRNAYEGGWQPLDLVHVARWRGSRAAGPWIGRAVLAEAERARARLRAPARWVDQLDQLAGDGGVFGITDSDEWSAALSALAVLHSLPTVELITPPPSTWDRPETRIAFSSLNTGRPEDKMLARIRSLLAKAESTEFPAEADAFTAKAQDLMTRHAIDEAVVRAEHRHTSRVGAIRVILEPPYTKEKAVILHVVAKANHARAVWNDWANFVTLIGVAQDVDHVEMLFTSLLVQATRAMTATGEEAATRSIGYRKSFLSGYAVRLGDRLAESAHRAEDSYGGDILPVLAAQDEAVRAEVERLFPSLRRNERGAGRFDARGWSAGQQAAEDAVLPGGQLRGTDENRETAD